MTFELDEKDMERILVPVQVSRLPRSVSTVCKNIETRFLETSNALIATAEKLEARALELRKRADELHSQIPLGGELRQAVEFEIECFEEVKSLALVDVGMRQE